MGFLKRLTAICFVVAVAMPAFGAQIRVLSATVDNKRINDAHVIWQREGEADQQTATNASGKAPLSTLADDKNTTLTIEKLGYARLVMPCPCSGLTYALSPIMNDLNQVRVVLTWAGEPRDLDAHLRMFGEHIYFGHRKDVSARLDVDNYNYFGPETITFKSGLLGQRYVYAVNDKTNWHKLTSYALSNSKAKVQVYVGQTLIRTYEVKPNKNALSWVVFAIDEDGNFHDINQYLLLNGEDLSKHMTSLVGSGSFKNQEFASPATIKKAKWFNELGEERYHESHPKHLEQAMYLFIDAVNLYPDYGQAYSNLGLTYQKLHRTAEALWANRKAIALAHGKSRAITQASSYYNIARIYEDKGMLQPALEAYQKANTLRPRAAYEKAIKRLKAQLD
ncbi:YfaP family protein [Gallaecimonas mangrovi]|uniref:YfaP family protein n=1 Tax=Gallaecimonas mangrovi TaxID=2291597 RepID=UPI000E206AC0|nr:tetratricopeptide repeat protein [Gallaecimonas mangrovi]